MKMKTIKDGQTLVAARTATGTPVKVYDDTFGGLYTVCHPYGIVGVIRAQGESNAYDIMVDEFLPEASETVAELEKEYSTIYVSGRAVPEQYLTPADRLCKAWEIPGRDIPFIEHFSNHPCFQEAYTYRPNGPRVDDEHGHGIACKAGYELRPFTSSSNLPVVREWIEEIQLDIDEDEDALVFANFERFELGFLPEDAESVAGCGDQTENTVALCRKYYIRAQFAKISDEDLIAELREYGAWEIEELQDRTANEQRAVWIGGNNAIEESRCACQDDED